MKIEQTGTLGGYLAVFRAAPDLKFRRHINLKALPLVEGDIVAPIGSPQFVCEVMSCNGSMVQIRYLKEPELQGWDEAINYQKLSKRETKRYQ